MLVLSPNDEKTSKTIFPERVTLAPLGDLMEDRPDSAGSLIVIVQKETIMVEVQVLVVKMERRHIQEMFSRESQ